jgi:hypothetical protein
MLILLVVAGCLPSIAYLCYHVGRKLKVRLGRMKPGEGLVQVVLGSIAVFCFITGLLLVVLPFTGHIPYYRQERGLIVALLFLLMGVLAVQVMQFIRVQAKTITPRRETRSAGRRSGHRRAGQSPAGRYAVSDSKS